MSASPLEYAEMIVSDTNRAADFLAAVFGWVKGEPWDEPEGYRQMTSQAGATIVGVGRPQGAGVPAGTTIAYVTVDDMSATLERAVKAGGRVLVPKTEIGRGMGYWGLIEVPGGVKLGLWSKQ